MQFTGILKGTMHVGLNGGVKCVDGDARKAEPRAPKEMTSETNATWGVGETSERDVHAHTIIANGAAVCAELKVLLKARSRRGPRPRTHPGRHKWCTGL